MSSSDYTESGSEYTDSESSSLETDSEDSYIYPWQDAEIDRFSSFDDLSSDDLMQKILDSLPVYDPPQSDSDGNFEYPDPNLYAVADADPSEELKVIDDATPGTQYLPESDDLYLKWIEEFELIQYPDYFADIDEPQADEEKEPAVLLDISAVGVGVPDSPTSTEPAEIDRRRQELPSVDTNDSTLPPSDRPQSARAGRAGQRRSTTRTQEMRRSQSHRQRAKSSRVGRGPSTKLDPFAPRQGSDRRTHTPDPSETTQARARQSQTAPSTPRKQAKSVSPSPRRPPRANTIDPTRPPRKKRTNEFARQRFKVGKKVKVFGETAVIRFIGEVSDPSLPGEIFGIEFLHDTEHGEHDGILPNGEEVFKVDVPGRGLFVRKKQVKPIRKHARRVARFCGNVQAFERNLLKERFDARRRGRGKVAKKLGPRDIGRATYRPEEYDLKDDNTSFLAPRATTKSKSTASVGKVRKKQGPRDIGRSDYRPQEFKEGGGRQDSMAERGMMSPRGARGSRPPKKLGPREMRKKSNASAKSWKPPDYQIQDSGSFLEERVVRSKSQVKKRVPKKKGPRDYKRNGAATPTSESPRHINNEHQPRKKRNKSRDRRRRKRRSSSSQAEAGLPRQTSTQSDAGSVGLPPEIEIASGED